MFELRARSARLGERLCPHDLEPHRWFVADDPPVMTGRNLVDVSWSELHLRAVFHADADPAGDEMTQVMRLAAIRACYRLDVFRPVPPAPVRRAPSVEWDSAWPRFLDEEPGRARSVRMVWDRAAVQPWWSCDGNPNGGSPRNIAATTTVVNFSRAPAVRDAHCRSHRGAESILDSRQRRPEYGMRRDHDRLPLVRVVFRGGIEIQGGHHADVTDAPDRRTEQEPRCQIGARQHRADRGKNHATGSAISGVRGNPGCLELRALAIRIFPGLLRRVLRDLDRRRR